MGGLARIHVRNYRALADVELNVGPINLVFGPNGAGKSTLLDSLYFFRDCAIRGVETASSERDHGIGILWDGAVAHPRITVELEYGDVTYGLSFVLSSGRIDPFPGERLLSSTRPTALIDRRSGSDRASLFHTNIGQAVEIGLREPEKLSLGLFLDFNSGDEEARPLDQLLHYIRLYHSRSFLLHILKRVGSESSPQTRLWDLGNNAWSVLRNLQDKRNVDDRYDTIMRHMTDAFPEFDDIVLQQTGPSTVYASLLERGRRSEIFASGASDGVLQLLLLLIALFSEGHRESVLLFDEPETSLHPWAMVVFARAVKLAAEQWNKQVFVATHSPVLISQFEPRDILVAAVEDGRARFDRLSEIDEMRDLLEDYAAGSLYMSEVIAGQRPQGLKEGNR
ncbi:MAG: AAA family ATPase [Spirochaetaceae bacterium]|nr:AAA family ATPase [Spirochaetaceae bacterium]